MESKFKVGDRVRYLPCKDSGEWQNVTITSIDGGMYWGNDDNPKWQDGLFPESLIELIEENPESKALSLLRKIVDHGGYGAIVVEAKAILADIEPVDGDIAEARKICASFWSTDEMRNKTMAGEIDDGKSVQAVLQAIKRGRELERGE